MEPAYKFFGIGFAIAALEEFISQGVLKRSLAGWIIPTIIAFLPFLMIVRTIGRFVDRQFGERQSALIYYLVAGGIGLLVEWFLIGLSPWSSGGKHLPAMLVLQAGMFSFWSAVAFVPRLLLDRREDLSRLRTALKRFLVIGMVFIYALTFAAPKDFQFAAGIGSILLVFIGSNFYYVRYLQLLAARE